MGRPLSPFLTSFFADRATADRRVYNTQLALDISLRGGGNLRLATKDLVMSSFTKGGASLTTGMPLSFVGRIEETPDIVFSQGEQADGSGTYDVTNLDYILSAIIPEATRPLDRAEVTAYLCYPKDDGTYEGQIITRGFLRLGEGDDETAQLSFVVDVSDKSIWAAGRELTQRCLNEFAVMDVAKRSWCGAANDTANIPPGSTCSKVFEDEDNGCVFWGQENTFQGVSFFNPNGLVAGYGGPIIIEPWNPDDNPGGCCDPDGWWLFADGEWRGGECVQKGEALQAPDGSIGMVEEVRKFWSEYRYLVTTSTGARVICTPSHPLIRSLADTEGKSAMVMYGQLPKDPNMRIMDFATRPAMSRFQIEPWTPGWALQISMSSPNIYICGMKPGLGIAGHNEKPIYTVGNY